MIPRRQSNSVINICRGKSTRRFGNDLTNMNVVSNNSKSNGLSSQYYSYNMYDPLEQKLKIQKKTTILSQILRTNSIINHHPLEDHFTDIKSYVTDQTIYWAIPEDYMRWHSQINTDMRENLVCWLIRLSYEFKLSQNTINLAVNLIDHYCYRKNIIKNKYQLLGICCLFMAAKYQQVVTPRLNRYLQACGAKYLKKEFVIMESDILDSINFQMNKAVSARNLTFIRVQNQFTNTSICSQDNTNEDFKKQQVIILCEYILQMMLLQYQFCQFSPNYLSAALLYVSCKMKNVQGVKSKFIIDKYQLIEEQFKDCFFKILNLYKRRNQLKFKHINKKYQIFDTQF